MNHFKEVYAGAVQYHQDYNFAHVLQSPINLSDSILALFYIIDCPKQNMNFSTPIFSKIGNMDSQVTIDLIIILFPQISTYFAFSIQIQRPTEFLKYSNHFQTLTSYAENSISYLARESRYIIAISVTFASIISFNLHYNTR